MNKKSGRNIAKMSIKLSIRVIGMEEYQVFVIIQEFVKLDIQLACYLPLPIIDFRRAKSPFFLGAGAAFEPAFA